MKRQAACCLIILTVLIVPAESLGQTAPQPQSSYESIPAFNVAETPGVLDRIAFVRHWFGPPKPHRSPRAVLILVPGFFGGAEDFRYVGERLVTRLPWLEVWAVDRRNNLLENRCGMEVAQKLRNPLVAVAYYLDARDIPGCPRHQDANEGIWNGEAEFAISQPEAVAIGMARWGLATELEDLRLLIAFARRQHRQSQVFLGGHSLGGMTAQIFAAWCFGPCLTDAGWRLLDGIVLIDGGVNGPAWTPTLLGQYFFGRDLVDTGTVYWNIPEIGRIPLIGQFAEIGGMAASLMPAQESILWHVLRPPFTWPDRTTCPTNKALLAAFSDNDTGQNPDFLMHQGTLVPTRDICVAVPGENRVLLHWLDFDQVRPPELSSTDIWAEALWKSTPTNAVEWYFSIMLNADIDLASNLDSRVPISANGPTAVELEGHRVFDAEFVALPVYAFAADECVGRFVWYGSTSKWFTDFTLVDHSNSGCPAPSAVPYAHLDPLFASDTGGFTNAFISTVSRWLSSHTAGP